MRPAQRSALMLHFMQIVTTLLVAIAMALPLAHALELPGKLRLAREQYLQVQPIYYPGFTIGGAVGEFGGIIATAVLAFVTPFGGMGFWLTCAALAALLLMHGVFWVMTQPVNNFWLKEEGLQGAGRAFFALGSHTRRTDWRALRDQWEGSHVIRAGLGFIALALLIVAISVT